MTEKQTMKKIEFFARGIPKGQPRTKACRFGSSARVYTPGTADDWKGIIRIEAQRAWDGVPLTGPVQVGLSFQLQRPAAHNGKQGLKPWAPRYHTGKPDADNLAKAVMDALSNVGIWRDDSQVSILFVSKAYSNSAETGCAIELKEIVA